MLAQIRGIVRKSNRLAAVMAMATAEGNMTATVRVTRGGSQAPTWDPVTHQLVIGEAELIWGPDTVGDPAPGIARIMTVSGPVTMTLGDEPQYFQSTFITIPLRAPIPETDDLIQVVTAPDAKLVDRWFRVVDVERGGQLPVGHRMQVVGIEPGKTWRPA